MTTATHSKDLLAVNDHLGEALMGSLLVKQLTLVRDAHLLASAPWTRVRVVPWSTHVEEGGSEAHSQVACRHLGTPVGNSIHMFKMFLFKVIFYF